MSLRELLGLEHSDLTDEEIMKLLGAALRSHHPDVELGTGKDYVTVHLCDIDPANTNFV